MLRRTLTALSLFALCLIDNAATGPRLELIQKRGFLTCGIEPAVPGFAEVDARGRYRGFDIDMCRALAAAVFGTPDKIKFVEVASVSAFLKNDDIDVVARRLTWELRREGPLPILFGPITFYDGQGFLVARSLKARSLRDLSGTEVCVAGGTNFEFNLGAQFNSHRLTLKKSSTTSCSSGTAGWCTCSTRRHPPRRPPSRSRATSSRASDRHPISGPGCQGARRPPWNAPPVAPADECARRQARGLVDALLTHTVRARRRSTAGRGEHPGDE